MILQGKSNRIKGTIFCMENIIQEVKQLNELLKYCNSILQELNISDISVVKMSEDILDQMYFNIDDRKIYVNEYQLREGAQEYSIPFNSYVKIIFLHELGHAYDKNLNSLYDDSKSCIIKVKENPFSSRVDGLLLRIKENSLQAERNAWEFAKRFIDDELIDIFNLIKTNGLIESEAIESLEMENIKLTIEIAQKEISNI